MNINIFNILILLGAAQGIVLPICLFFSKKYNKVKANISIAIVVLCFSLTNLQSWFFDAGITRTDPYIILFFLPWEMLCPPAFYMFTIQYLNYKEKNKISRLLYLPFLTYLLIYIYHKIDAIFINVHQDLNELPRKPVFMLEAIVAIFLALLNGYFVYRILKKHKKTISDADKTNTRNPIDVGWYTKVFKICIGLCAFWGFTVIFQVVTNGLFGLYSYYPIWIGFTIFAYWIGYTGLQKLNISQQYYDEIKLLKSGRNSSELKTQISKSIVADDNKYYQEFMALLTNEKIFLDPLLSLEQVADKLNISANYLSQLINKTTERYFSDIIGQFRVEEIKKMFNDQNYNECNILTIGYEAGFNSKSSIYKTFKKFTNMTPAEYREQLIDQRIVDAKNI